MEYTGERVIPKKMDPQNGLLLEHIARYEFARQFAKGRVLDIACGSGYGSELLCTGNDGLDEIVGIDISEESIEYAKEHYSYSNTSYYVDDALNRNLHRVYGQFDTVISFETIEHFEGDKVFVENIHNLLKPGGKFIVSTPFGRGKGEPCTCPFHVYQYREEEFLEVLSPFKSLEMYNQSSEVIEIPKADKKYYLMIAVCEK